MKHILFISTILFGLLGSSSQARITPFAFKEVTKYFKKDVYSPTMGMVALETGLIENLRFYGNFTAGVNKNGGRDRGKDKSTDPVWSLLKELFPSIAGDLNPIINNGDNFGKHVSSAKTIALLLHYAHSLRNGELNLSQEISEPLNEKPKVIKEKEKKIPPTYRLTLYEYDELIKEGILIASEAHKEVSVKYEEFLKSNLSATEKQKKTFQQKNKILLNNEKKIKKVMNHKNKQHISNNKISQPKIKISTKKENIYPVEKVFESLTLSEKTTQKNLKKTVTKILKFIHDAILSEKNSSFYPPYQTEQIILAFFCEKFNGPEDIKELIKELKELDTKGEIINREMLNDISIPLLEKKDLVEIYKKENYTIDDFYILANGDSFSRVTPYKAGASLISNANTYAYKRSNPKDQSMTFPDCVEVAIRHIFNLTLFRPETNKSAMKFDLSSLEKHLDNKEIFLSLEKFYQKQSPQLANSGDINTRSLWNQVVGDLNDLSLLKEIKVQYDKGGETKYYDMDPGFINVANVFRKLIGITLTEKKMATLDLDKASLEEKRGWVKAYFDAAFKILNPNDKYDIDTSKLEEKPGRHQQDLFGEMTVTVYDTNTSHKKFSYTISMTPGHGQLYNLQAETITNLTQIKEVHWNDPIKNSLNLLLPELKVKLTMPLYILYQDLIQDNTARFKTLERLSVLVKETKIDKDIFNQLSQSLTHLLDNLSWDDRYILDEIMPFLPILQPFFPEILKNHVQVYQSDTVDDNQLKEIVEQFPNLKILKLNNNRNLETLPDLSKLKNLEEIALEESSSLSNIDGLEGCTALKKINLYDTEKLEKLPVLSKLTNLEEINLTYSSISDINGLMGCTALKKINLRNTQKLEKLPVLSKLTNLEEIRLRYSNVSNIDGLEGCTALKKIDLGSSGVSDINGLMDCTALKTIDLRSTQNLKEIPVLSKLTKLEEINLKNSGVSNIQGLMDCTALKKISLSKAQNLKEIPDLSKLTNLEEISLSYLHVSNIDALKDCTALKKIDLSCTKTPEEFPNLSKLKKLEWIDLSNLDGSHIDGLKDCTALKTINLYYTKKLEKLPVLSKLTKLEEINLKRSGVSDINGLKGCTALKQINLSETENLKEIPDLSTLKNLKYIDLSGSDISNIDGLKDCTVLDRIDLRKAQNLKEIPDFLKREGIKVIR